MLPNLVVIGAMRCGTTALHGYLDAHPDIAMAPQKELNFFVGGPSAGADWHAGNWHRGLDWYRGCFAGSAPVRGEASPAYTSPSFPEAAERMATLIPDARLVYLVRDPIERMVSQYCHHRRDGTEDRPLDTALLDPESQYLARSRFHERLEPFLSRFPAERILVLLHEEFRARPAEIVARVCRFAGVDPDVDVAGDTAGTVMPPTSIDPDLERRLVAALADDVARLRALLGRDLAEWRAY